MKTYFRTFAHKSAALEACRSVNRSFKDAGNKRDLVAVVEGPDNDWCVVDLLTAIDLGQGYTII